MCVDLSGHSLADALIYSHSIHIFFFKASVSCHHTQLKNHKRSKKLSKKITVKELNQMVTACGYQVSQTTIKSVHANKLFGSFSKPY